MTYHRILTCTHTHTIMRWEALDFVWQRITYGFRKTIHFHHHEFIRILNAMPYDFFSLLLDTFHGKFWHECFFALKRQNVFVYIVTNLKLTFYRSSRKYIYGLSLSVCELCCAVSQDPISVVNRNKWNWTFCPKCHWQRNYRRSVSVFPFPFGEMKAKKFKWMKKWRKIKIIFKHNENT